MTFRRAPACNSSSDDMAEQPVNLSTVIYLGVFSGAEQRVLQVIFKEIAEGGGSCAATLALIARDSNTSRSTTRNAIAQAVAIGLLERTERRSYCAVSLPNILSYGQTPSPAPDVGMRTTALRVQQRTSRPDQGRSGNKKPLRPAGLSSMEIDRAARPAALRHCRREFECVCLHTSRCSRSRCGRFIYCDAAAPSATDSCKEFKKIGSRRVANDPSTDVRQSRTKNASKFNWNFSRPIAQFFLMIERAAPYTHRCARLGLRTENPPNPITALLAKAAEQNRRFQ
jgi:hypothetical protein